MTVTIPHPTTPPTYLPFAHVSSHVTNIPDQPRYQGASDPILSLRLDQPQASVAQGIEHRSPKAGAAGSNPAGGTIVMSQDIGNP